MNTPNPDDLRSDLPQQPPTEIQAGRPTPRGDDPLPPVEYNFKKPASLGWGTWGPIVVLVGVCLVLWSISFLGQVTNKTFSNVTSCFSSPGPHPAWYPPGQDPWELEQKQKKTTDK